jgi:hypothetical protein
VRFARSERYEGWLKGRCTGPDFGRGRIEDDFLGPPVLAVIDLIVHIQGHNDVSVQEFGKIFSMNLCHSSVKWCSDSVHIDTGEAIRRISASCNPPLASRARKLMERGLGSHHDFQK